MVESIRILSTQTKHMSSMLGDLMAKSSKKRKTTEPEQQPPSSDNCLYHVSVVCHDCDTCEQYFLADSGLDSEVRSLIQRRLSLDHVGNRTSDWDVKMACLTPHACAETTLLGKLDDDSLESLELEWLRREPTLDIKPYDSLASVVVRLQDDWKMVLGLE